MQRGWADVYADYVHWSEILDLKNMSIYVYYYILHERSIYNIIICFSVTLSNI